MSLVAPDQTLRLAVCPLHHHPQVTTLMDTYRLHLLPYLVQVRVCMCSMNFA